MPKLKITLVAAALALCACAKTEAPAVVTAVAAPAAQAAAGIEGCAKIVLAKYPGDILQATLKTESEGATWELEIKQADGKLWDVECNAASGKLVEEEGRVATATDPAFAAKVKVDEATATKTALEKHPGTVERVEYEMEPDGKASYEFDIKTATGDMRVEVDTESGAIVEESPELLEIGGV